jgi:hypothetical protein
MEFYGAMHEQEVHAVRTFAMKRAVLSPLGNKLIGWVATVAWVCKMLAFACAYAGCITFATRYIGYDETQGVLIAIASFAVMYGLIWAVAGLYMRGEKVEMYPISCAAVHPLRPPSMDIEMP